MQLNIRPLQPLVGLRPAVVISLLLGAFMTAALGNSLQSISIMAWMQPFLLLLAYEGAVTSFRSAVLAYVLILAVQVLGFTVAFLGALSYPKPTALSLLATLSLGMAVSTAVTFGALLPAMHLRSLSAELLQRRRTTTCPHIPPDQLPPLSPLGWALLILPLWAYPVLHTAVSTLTGLLLGHFHDVGVAVADWSTVAQLSSLFGLWGINFIVDLAASAAFLFFTHQRLPFEPSTAGDTSDGDAAEPFSGGGSTAMTAAAAAAAWPRLCRPLRRHLLVVAGLLVALAAAGGGLVYGDSFYQRSVATQLAVERRLPVSCLTAESADVGGSDWLWLWQRTAERVAAGDAFVLWSEEAAALRDDQEELALFATARDLLATATRRPLSAYGRNNPAVEASDVTEAAADPGLAERGRTASTSATSASPAPWAGTYLGLCYAKAGRNGSSSNHFALMDPNGTVLWNYRKAYPVPVVEARVVRGPSHIPTASSPYGTLGGAICFDLDRPSYIRQAGAAGVELLLQPSWTWGAVGPRHFAANALRAIENGFTTLRCSSSGVSGAISPRGVVWHYLLTGSRDVLTFTLPLHPRTTTAYVAGGWVFEWLNLAVAGVLAALLLVPPKRLGRWVGRPLGPPQASAGGAAVVTSRAGGRGGRLDGDVEGRQPLLPRS